MRLGWVAAHPQILSRFLNVGGLQSGGGFNPFTGAIFSELFESGFMDKHVRHIRKHYSETSQVLCAAIDDYLCTAVEENEHVHYHRPTGGFFCFVTLPERYDTQQLLEIAQSRGVSYFVGRNSSPDKTLFKSSIRLCYAWLEKDMITEGVRRLGEAVKEYRKKYLSTSAQKEEH